MAITVLRVAVVLFPFVVWSCGGAAASSPRPSDTSDASLDAPVDSAEDDAALENVDFASFEMSADASDVAFDTGSDVVTDASDASGDVKSDTDANSPDASSDVGVSEAGRCIDVEVLPSELVCTKDADCSLVVTGRVCPWDVAPVSRLGTLCYGGAANGSGVARIGALVAATAQGDDAEFDFCDVAVGNPRCIAAQCIQCSPFGEEPAACADAGSSVIDGG